MHNTDHKHYDAGIIDLSKTMHMQIFTHSNGRELITYTRLHLPHVVG